MQSNNLEIEDELPGVVCSQMVRCSRANCRCAKGHLHGPYHYRFWRESGVLKKEYVPCKNVEKVSAACARRQARETSERENLQVKEKEIRQWFQETKTFLRQVEAELHREKEHQK